MRGLILLGGVLLLSSVLRAQMSDSSSADTIRADTAKEHAPRSATLRSAILPGLGQAYNRKYWKIPIVYAGLGASAYFIVRNTQQYNDFQNALIARNDPDQNDAYQGIYTEQQLSTLKSTYRRWRDLSYISFIAVYVLQVVDANVDAHLYDFDVSDDLSLRIEPWSGRTGSSFRSLASGNGVSLSVRF